MPPSPLQPTSPAAKVAKSLSDNGEASRLLRVPHRAIRSVATVAVPEGSSRTVGNSHDGKAVRALVGDDATWRLLFPTVRSALTPSRGAV